MLLEDCVVYNMSMNWGEEICHLFINGMILTRSTR